jgi:hypothetical protein
MAIPKVPNDIKEKIEAFATSKGVDIGELRTKFGEIYDTDEICQGIENPEARMRTAMGTLLSGYTSGGGKGVPVIVRIVSKSSFRRVGTDQRKVADVYCMLQEFDEEGESLLPGVDYSDVTLWQDATDLLDSIIEGSIYQINLIKDAEDKQPEWGVGFHTGSPEVRFEEVNAEMETFIDFYKRVIEPMEIDVTLDQVDMYISDYNTDIRRIYGTVMRAEKGNDNQTGKPYAVYNIIDATSNEEFTVWCSQEQMKYGRGSDLYFVGTVIKSKKGDVYMNAHIVLPVSASSITPLRLKPKPVKQDQQEEADLGEPEPERDPNAEDDGVKF